MSKRAFNDLSPAQGERLAILSEELGEAVQVVGKILRHGLYSYNPHDVDKTTNNTLLEKELGDVLFATRQLVAAGEIDQENIEDWATEKVTKISKYLHHHKLRKG